MLLLALTQIIAVKIEPDMLFVLYAHCYLSVICGYFDSLSRFHMDQHPC